MARFRKQPIEVEAFRWTGGPDQEEDPEWIVSAIKDKTVIILYNGPPDWGFSMQIKTLEGTMIAHPGDWIIQGINGELYPCKHDIFKVTYEPV